MKLPKQLIRWLHFHPVVTYYLSAIYIISITLFVIPVVFTTFETRKWVSWLIIIDIYLIHFIALFLLLRKRSIQRIVSVYGKGTNEYKQAMKVAGFRDGKTDHIIGSIIIGILFIGLIIFFITSPSNTFH